MAKARNPWISIRGGLAPAAGVLIVAFFAGYAIFGANGVIAWTDYARKLKAKNIELASIQKQRDVLANRVRLLDPKKADPDLVDELARKNLGVAGSDEVIVPLD
jgi:cell division protein FtsB